MTEKLVRIGNVVVKYLTKVIRIIICPRCGYEWESVVEFPRKCPRCQKRLDWTGKKNRRNKKGGKEQDSRAQL